MTDVDIATGVHSLTDVAVFASGPGAHLFRGVYDNLCVFSAADGSRFRLMMSLNRDIFYKVADALALGNFAQ